MSSGDAVNESINPVNIANIGTVWDPVEHGDLGSMWGGVRNGRLIFVSTLLVVG